MRRYLFVNLKNKQVLVEYISPHNYCEDNILKSVEDGYFLSDLFVGQRLCYSGQYCINGKSTGCEIGTYQDKRGQTSCEDCPAGTFCDKRFTRQPKKCPPGTYQENSRSSSCDNCLPGHYCPYFNMTAMSECPPGTYQPNYGYYLSQSF